LSEHLQILRMLYATWMHIEVKKLKWWNDLLQNFIWPAKLIQIILTYTNVSYRIDLRAWKVNASKTHTITGITAICHKVHTKEVKEVIGFLLYNLLCLELSIVYVNFQEVVPEMKKRCALPYRIKIYGWSGGRRLSTIKVKLILTIFFLKVKPLLKCVPDWAVNGNTATMDKAVIAEWVTAMSDWAE